MATRRTKRTRRKIPRRDARTGRFLKAARPNPGRAHRNCGCAPNPRVRGGYPVAGPGVAAYLELNRAETAAWRKGDYRVRNKIMRAAQTVSARNQYKTVIIKAASGRELERTRAYG